MQGNASSAQLLSYFDSLPALPAEQLIGYAWKGGGFKGQTATAVMHATGWWGKLFYARDQVEALVHACAWTNPIGVLIRVLFFWRQVWAETYCIFGPQGHLFEGLGFGLRRCRTAFGMEQAQPMSTLILALGSGFLSSTFLCRTASNHDDQSRHDWCLEKMR